MPESVSEIIAKKIPDDKTMGEVAELFKVFGDATRAKILSCLEVRDLYVGEIAEILGKSEKFLYLFL